MEEMTDPTAELRKAYEAEDVDKLERLVDAHPSLLGELTTTTFGLSLRHVEEGRACDLDCGCESLWQVLRRGFEAHPEARSHANPVSLGIVGMLPDDRRRTVKLVASGLAGDDVEGSDLVELFSRTNPYVQLRRRE